MHISALIALYSGFPFTSTLKLSSHLYVHTNLKNTSATVWQMDLPSHLPSRLQCPPCRGRSRHDANFRSGPSLTPSFYESFFDSFFCKSILDSFSTNRSLTPFIQLILFHQMALYSIVDMDERDQMLTTNCIFLFILHLMIKIMMIRDAKSGRYGRYICAIVSKIVLIFGPCSAVMLFIKQKYPSFRFNTSLICLIFMTISNICGQKRLSHQNH